MFYVIVNNDNVIFGPREWNRLLFQSVIEDDFDIVVPLSYSHDGSPVIINDSIKILPILDKPKPQHNSKIQELSGPFWEIKDDHAVNYYGVVDKSVDIVKSELKKLVEENRYQREISGINVTIGTVEVPVTTNRDGREIYFHQSITATDTPVSFKFGGIWLNVTKNDFLNICNAIHDFVQKTFDWEQSMWDEIDSKNTLEELNNLDLSYKESAEIIQFPQQRVA
jgi:hypothetical protein